jgi:fibronectin type 3 domain-containing protein
MATPTWNNSGSILNVTVGTFAVDPGLKKINLRLHLSGSAIGTLKRRAECYVRPAGGGTVRSMFKLDKISMPTSTVAYAGIASRLSPGTAYDVSVIFTDGSNNVEVVALNQTTVSYPALPGTLVATHYIAETGSDSNPGTSGSPWRTHAKAMTTAPAGSMVSVGGGLYPRCNTARGAGLGAITFFTPFPSADDTNVDGGGPQAINVGANRPTFATFFTAPTSGATTGVLQATAPAGETDPRFMKGVTTPTNGNAWVVATHSTLGYTCWKLDTTTPGVSEMVAWSDTKHGDLHMLGVFKTQTGAMDTADHAIELLNTARDHHYGAVRIGTTLFVKLPPHASSSNPNNLYMWWSPGNANYGAALFETSNPDIRMSGHRFNCHVNGVLLDGGTSHRCIVDHCEFQNVLYGVSVRGAGNSGTNTSALVSTYAQRPMIWRNRFVTKELAHTDPVNNPTIAWQYIKGQIGKDGGTTAVWKASTNNAAGNAPANYDANRRLADSCEGQAVYLRGGGNTVIIAENYVSGLFNVFGAYNPGYDRLATYGTEIFDNYVELIADDCVEYENQAINWELHGNRWKNILIVYSHAPVEFGPLFHWGNRAYRFGMHHIRQVAENVSSQNSPAGAYIKYLKAAVESALIVMVNETAWTDKTTAVNASGVVSVLANGQLVNIDLKGSAGGSGTLEDRFYLRNNIFAGVGRYAGDFPSNASATDETNLFLDEDYNYFSHRNIPVLNSPFKYGGSIKATVGAYRTSATHTINSIVTNQGVHTNAGLPGGGLTGSDNWNVQVETPANQFSTDPAAGSDTLNLASNSKFVDAGTQVLGFMDQSGVHFIGTPDLGAVQYTTPGSNPPNAPSGLTATPAGNTQIDLGWTDNSGDEDHFEIERAVGAGSYSLLVTLNPNVTSYSDTGLNPSTQYSYRVRATNVNGASAYSTPATATTSGSAPNTPINLAAVPASAGQIDLTWDDGGGSPTSYLVEQSPNGSTGWQQIGVTSSTSFSASGLNAATTYWFRVRASNTNGTSAYTTPVFASTGSLPTPATPSNLNASRISSTSIGLSWSDNSTNETRFDIERSLSGQNSFQQIAQVNADVTSYTDSGLLPGTLYDYRVRAANTGGTSGWSNTATQTTRPDPATNFVGTATSATTARLTWTPPAGGISSYTLERRLSGGTFVVIATIPNSAVLYDDSGLTASQTYEYRMYTGGPLSTASGYTATATVNTPAAGIPNDPTSLSVAARSPSQARLSWIDNGGGTLGFYVERSPNGSTNWVQIGSVGVISSVIVGGLTPNGVYYFRVRAFGSGGPSGYTSTVSITMPSSRPRVFSLTNRKFTLSTVAAAPVTGPVTLSPTLPEKWGRAELTFDLISTTAVNYQIPYEASPVTGVPAAIGVTVDVELSQDPAFASYLTRPAFWYLPFTRHATAEYGNKDAFAVSGPGTWKCRFMPTETGLWYYRIRQTDINGTKLSSVSSFTVAAAQTGVKGPILRSPTNYKFFEHADGSPAILTLGLHPNGHNGSDGISESTYRYATMGSDLTKLGSAGPNLMRLWINTRFGIPVSGGMASQSTGNQLFGCDIGNAFNSFGFYYQLPVGYYAAWYMTNTANGGPTTYTFNPIEVEPNGIRYRVSVLAKVRIRSTTANNADTGWSVVVENSNSSTVSTIIGPVTTDNNSWQWYTGEITTTSTRDEFGLLQFKLRDAGSTSYVQIVEVKVEKIIGGAGGTPVLNLIERNRADFHLSYSQKASWLLDYWLDECKARGIYNILSIQTKDERLHQHLDEDGTPLNDTEAAALGSGLDAKREQNQYCHVSTVPEHPNLTLYKYYWRWLDARWGDNPAVLGYELWNEGNPTSGDHFMVAEALHDYMAASAHPKPCSTSNYHSLPTGNWVSYDVDWFDQHRYMGDGTSTTTPYGENAGSAGDGCQIWPGWDSKEQTGVCAFNTDSAILTAADAPGGGALPRGTRCLEITGRNTQFEALCYVVPGRTVRVSFDAKGVGLTTSNALVAPGVALTTAPRHSRDGSQTYYSNKTGSADIGTYDWKRFTVDIVIPAGHYTLTLTPTRNHDSAVTTAGTIYIDNITVVDQTSSRHLLMNGNFEMGRYDYDSAMAHYYRAFQTYNAALVIQKPATRGETNINNGSDVHWSLLASDTQAVWAHKWLFAHIGGNLGYGLHDILWECAEILGGSADKTAFWDRYRAIVAGLPITDATWGPIESATCSDANLRAWGSGKADHGILWVDNLTDIWHRHAGQSGGTAAVAAIASGKTVTVPNLTAGNYTVEWWSTHTGTMLSSSTVATSGTTLTLTIPVAFGATAFGTTYGDVVAKFVRQ